MSYDMKPIQAPRLTGDLLRVVTFLMENPLTGGVLGEKLLKDAGIFQLRETPMEPPDAPLPAIHPLLEKTPESTEERPPLTPSSIEASQPGRGFTFETAEHFSTAYREGRVTPEEVALRILEFVSASDRQNPPLRAFIAQDADDILRQARASTERYRRGEPLGPLDGVPVAVKDEVDQVPYPTTVGTRFLGKEPASRDSEVVARLRAAGALLCGKTNMHEMGLGVTGLNPHHGAARNPYDPRCATGGSSSGSAAAVAAGFCPLAVGADGGGSIRIPAGLCGVVGLKATFGRISEFGAAPLCWSLAHIGPIGASARDVALGYAVMAGPDPKDPNTRRQPAPHLADLTNGDLRGLRLGIYRPWFEDADVGVVAAARRILEILREAGAQVVEVDIPELGLLQTVHLVTIVSEMAAAHLAHYSRHQKEYGLDTRLNLALARRLQAYDYVQAQRHRVRLCQHFERVLSQVDVIVTPTTACTAPVLPEDALRTGESNLELISRIMRFAQPANVTGLPAISFPAGYDARGLPVGFQAMGRAWEEHTLLRLAWAAERFVERREPRVHYKLLRKP